MPRWWQNSQPGEVREIPFLAPQVIEHLEGLLNPEWRILEHGSGGSTLWFSERCSEVIAVENNELWRSFLLERNCSNVSIAPALPANVFGFDLMLIDGEPVGVRAEYLKRAYDLVRPGGYVVLDNANRPEYEKERAWMQENCESYQTFNCNESGTKYLVTEFYKLKGEL